MEAKNNVNSVLCAWYVCRKALNYRGSKLYNKIVKKNPRGRSPGSKGSPLEPGLQGLPSGYVPAVPRV